MIYFIYFGGSKCLKILHIIYCYFCVVKIFSTRMKSYLKLLLDILVFVILNVMDILYLYLYFMFIYFN